MVLNRPISVVLADDHPAVRTGLAALIDAEPGLLTAAAVGDAFAVAPAVRLHRPQVVILDYQLPGIDGLSLCRMIRRDPLPPAVLVYSAFADRDMIVPAHVAGAAGIVDKGTEPRELMQIIREVATGGDRLPPPTAGLIDAAGHRLAQDDRDLTEMLVNGATHAEAGAALGLPDEELEPRIDRLLARLVIAHHPT